MKKKAYLAVKKTAESIYKKSKNYNFDESICEKTSSFEELKEIISLYVKEHKLDVLRFDPCYTQIMGNGWLTDTPIARYGLTDDENPSNSIGAIKQAIKNNYSVLISVQVIADGNIVCFKNKALGIDTGENGYIANLNIEEVKKLKLNKTNYKILTLNECLEIISGKIPVIIEIITESAIGNFEENLNKLLNEYIIKYNAWNKIALLSMNPYSLEWFYKNAPYLTRIMKSCSFNGIKEYANIKTKKLKKLKLTKKIAHADYISYNAIDMPNEYIEKHKPYGVIAYNVTEQSQYEKLLEFSDNIIFSGFIPKI